MGQRLTRSQSIARCCSPLAIASLSATKDATRMLSARRASLLTRRGVVVVNPRPFTTTTITRAEIQLEVDGVQVSIEQGSSLIQACEKAGMLLVYSLLFTTPYSTPLPLCLPHSDTNQPGAVPFAHPIPRLPSMDPLCSSSISSYAAYHTSSQSQSPSPGAEGGITATTRTNAPSPPLGTAPSPRKAVQTGPRGRIVLEATHYQYCGFTRPQIASQNAQNRSNTVADPTLLLSPAPLGRFDCTTR